MSPSQAHYLCSLLWKNIVQLRKMLSNLIDTSNTNSYILLNRPNINHLRFVSDFWKLLQFFNCPTVSYISFIVSYLYQLSIISFVPLAECKERWKNVRAVLTRLMIAPKSGSQVKPRKPYYLSEAMKFTFHLGTMIFRRSANFSNRWHRDRFRGTTKVWLGDRKPLPMPPPPLPPQQKL